MKEGLEMNIDIELEEAINEAWAASRLTTGEVAYWAARAAAYSETYSAAYSATASAVDAEKSEEKQKQVEIIKEIL